MVENRFAPHFYSHTQIWNEFQNAIAISATTDSSLTMDTRHRRSPMVLVTRLGFYCRVQTMKLTKHRRIWTELWTVKNARASVTTHRKALAIVVLHGLIILLEVMRPRRDRYVCDVWRRVRTAMKYHNLELFSFLHVWIESVEMWSQRHGDAACGVCTRTMSSTTRACSCNSICVYIYHCYYL